jgi:hypothetical protein
MVLRRIFGLERQEVRRGGRKSYTKEFHKLFSSLNIVSVIISRKTRWIGYVTGMGELRNAGVD